MNAAKLEKLFSILGFGVLGVVTLAVLYRGLAYTLGAGMIVYDFNVVVMQRTLTPAQVQSVTSLVGGLILSSVLPLVVMNVAWIIAFLVVYFRLKAAPRSLA